MKLTFVVPRYGPEVRGGAENGARMLAEGVANKPGWQVEVLTSCALDFHTWQNFFEPGIFMVEGVTVKRFPVVAPRDISAFNALSDQVFSNISALSKQDELDWIKAQGPFCPELIQALEQSDADVIAFYPYLYYPTVIGLPRVSERAILHPAAHDEAPIYLSVFKEIFENSKGFIFHSDQEKLLVESIFSVAHLPQIILGLGVDKGVADPTTLDRFCLSQRPYVIYLGRIDEGKGVLELAKWFIAYKKRHVGPLALVLVGPIIDSPIEDPDIIVTGPVEEKDKWSLLQSAQLLIHPSPKESFSLSLMEGWITDCPAIVTQSSAVLRQHCLDSGGGVAYSDYFSFEASLERLLEDEALKSQLIASGKEYVNSLYKTSVVIERYCSFLEAILASRLRG